MYIQKLDYFIVIAETGNLTKAAEILHVSQPSLSQYLKRLENSLEVELFDRATSPLKLTYAGEKYYAYAKDSHRREENIRKELLDISGQVGGRLRLGVPLWRGSALLPHVFPAFHEKYPKIALEVFEGRADRLQKMLMNDGIDLAVMNLPRTINYDRLACEVFMEERIMLAMPVTHPEARPYLVATQDEDAHPEIPIDALKRVPLILTKPGQNLTYQITHILEMNRIQPEILLDTDNLTTAINLVAAQMGCAFVPGEGARICKRPGKVAYCAITGSVVDCVWDLGVFYRKDAYLSKIARLFIDELHTLRF